MAEREKRDVVILDEETKTLMDLFDRIYEQRFETIGVSTPAEPVREVTRRKPDLLVDHLRATDSGGMDLIKNIRKLSPKTQIILLGDRKARPREIDQN